MHIANRRESPRIDIKLRCHITSPVLWSQHDVYTEDISRGGLRIGWSGKAGMALPSLGQIVTVDIELPANHGFEQKCIHCQGTVIRVAEPESNAAHMALRVNYMDFRSFHDRLRAVEQRQPLAHTWMA